jgi:hypothetical protein
VACSLPASLFLHEHRFGFGLVCISGAGLYWLNIVFLAPLISIILLTTAFVARIEAPHEGYPRGAEFIGAAVMFMIIPVAAIIFSRRNGVGAVAIELSKNPD